jgi:hypothetical protein
MDVLINTLLSFLVPIVIVVTVVTRIYRTIKSAKDSQKTPLRATGLSIRPPEPADDEDDWKPPELDENDDAPAATAPVPASRKPPASVNTPIRPSVPAALPNAAAVSAYDLPPVSREPEQVRPAVPDFFRRLETRPIMQQAVILAEVLGPPKGME